MKQIEQSMAMFRKSCSEKIGVNKDLIDGMHRGEFPEDIKELKVCYFTTACNFELIDHFLCVVFHIVYRRVSWNCKCNSHLILSKCC